MTFGIQSACGNKYKCALACALALALARTLTLALAKTVTTNAFLIVINWVMYGYISFPSNGYCHEN